MTGLRPLDRRATLPVFAVALVVPFVLTACAKKQERQQRPPAMVVVQPARRATVPYVVEANGIVTPLQSAAVVPQVDGIIQSVDFQEGQEVQQGQALFHIDPRPYQNAYAQSLAVLARDSATWRNAQANAERTKQLLTSKVITPQEGDVTLTTAATTEATLRADQANLAQAKFNLDNTIIRAPISGQTGGLLVKRGNLVRSGSASPLVVINQVRPITIRFSVPSSQLGLVRQYGANGGLPVTAVPGGIAPATPSIDSLAAEAMAQGSDPLNESAGAGSDASRRGANPASAGGSVGSAAGAVGGPNAQLANAGAHMAGREANGGPNARSASRGAPGAAGASGAATSGSPVQQGAIIGERLSGKLSFIDNAVDTATGTVQLKATYENSARRHWPGQFATTSLHLFDEENALVVPQQAIVTGQRGSYVYIIDQADTARQRAVVVERTANGLAIISSGIHEGDRVVTEGHLRLMPDSPVRIRGAEPAATPSAGNGARRGRGGRGAGRRNGGGGGGG
jgi:multidrug efflux pump subunit AcrA (membrane-fusion protein)